MFCVRMRCAEKFWNCSVEWSGSSVGPISDDDLVYWRFIPAQEGFASLKDGDADIDHETRGLYWRRLEGLLRERFYDESERMKWNIRDTSVCYSCVEVLELVMWLPKMRPVRGEEREETDIVRFEGGTWGDQFRMIDDAPRWSGWPNWSMTSVVANWPSMS